jgi:hypothetical protein
MKILFLVEDIVKVSLQLRQDTNLKIIDEYEIASDTPYTDSGKPGYGDFIANRAAHLSKTYKFTKPLCIVIDQRHQNTLDKIPHDVSIRVCKTLVPKRLSDSFIQKVDKIYLEDDFTTDGLVA